MREYNTILVARERGITTLTLNRPEKLNALSLQMAEELREALTALERDPEVRVLVITGAGRAFSAGGDFQEFEQLLHNPKLAEQGARSFLEVNAAIRRLNIPSIAKLNGDVVGGACGIAMACDLRVAHEGVRFHFPFVRLGLSAADAGVTHFLPRLVGLGRAAKILLLGETLDAQEAERIGLVQYVVPIEDLDRKTRELAEQLLHFSPLALTATRKALYSGFSKDLGADFELEEQLQRLCFASEEHKRAVQAFLAKKAKREEQGRGHGHGQERG